MTVDVGKAPREDWPYRPDPKPVPVKKRRHVRPSLSGFRNAVVTRPCVLISLDCEGRLEAHHVIAAQKLRRIGREDLTTDPRNGMPLCERHHRRHTLGYAAIPFEFLPEEAVEFAEELGLRWWLVRRYPLGSTPRKENP